MASPQTWASINSDDLPCNEGLATWRHEDNEHPMSLARQRRWLRNSRSWKGLNGKQWRPKRILGAGSNGIVGLWEYTGDNQNMPRHIAVKQGLASDPGFRWESKLLQEIAMAKSEHLVKIYKAVYSEGGTGTERHRDPIPFDKETSQYNRIKEVARMYIEYCEDGTLYDHTKELFGATWKQEGGLPEEVLWRYLDCLAKALLVLERGTEDPDSDGLPGWGRPIAHFDIKPWNILVGKRDENHKRSHILKIADFGLAQRVPEQPDAEWIKRMEWRATEGFMAPEQKFRDHENRTIGAPTNVWSVGAVMFFLMHEEMDQEKIASKAFTYTFENGEDLLTMAPQLLDTQYSRTLVELVLRCLIWDPSHRITPASILRIIAPILTKYDTLTSSDPDGSIDGGTTPVIPPGGKPLSSRSRRHAKRRIITLPQPPFIPSDSMTWPSAVQPAAPGALMSGHHVPAAIDQAYIWRSGGFQVDDEEGEESTGWLSVEEDESPEPEEPPRTPGDAASLGLGQGMKRKRKGPKTRGVKSKFGVRVVGERGVVEEEEEEEEVLVGNLGQTFWGAYNGVPII